MARPSFHITARLACIVQRVKNRLKSHAKNHTVHSSSGRQGSNRLTARRNCAFDEIDACPSRTRLRYPRGAAQRIHGPTSDSVPGLIGILDAHVSNKEASLLTSASDNRLFLKHDHFQTWSDKSDAELNSIADTATALLTGLPDVSALHNIYNDSSLGSAVDNETFYANLVHLIISIKKLAMDAIVHTFLEAIQVNLLRWYQFWLHKYSNDDWFAEWPNGQRPLSTTWPWNIKPALLVLWGVCWMFYYDNEGRWCADNFGGAGNSAPNIMHGQGAQAATISQPEPAQSLLPWRDPATYPNYSWLQANAFDPWRASHGDSHIDTRSHLTSDSAFLNLDQPAAGTDSFVSPAFTSVSANPYISAAPAASSNPFAGPSSGIWPITSGINTENALAYDTGRSLYQVPTPVGSLDSVNKDIGSIHSWKPYVVSKSTPNSTGRGVTPNRSRAVLPSQQKRNMQDYPSPQMSDISGQMDPSYLACQSRIMTSPSRTLIKSPSISGFSTSPQSIEHEREPLRNAAGSFYCSHPACADKPPVFPRKCEWTKHMDKHTRPYICDEPGCENIRGFTYSGGLHRHRKEVHRQHGGPRSACLCPYKDCKRSTGLGFSRKENLAEHVRRVHRDAGQNQAHPADVFPDATDGPPATLGNRKRKRRAAENEGDETNGSQDSQDAQGLKQEVKRLKKELQEKDERLQRLEEQVRELLARDHQA